MDFWHFGQKLILQAVWSNFWRCLVKVSATSVWRSSRWPGTFSPGWIHQSSPGWIHQPGLKVPPLYPGRLLLPPRARAQHIFKLTALVFLLPSFIVPPSILRFLRRFLWFLRRFFSCKGYQSHTLIFHHWLISYCSLYIYCFYGVFLFVNNLSSK